MEKLNEIKEVLSSKEASTLMLKGIISTYPEIIGDHLYALTYALNMNHNDYSKVHERLTAEHAIRFFRTKNILENDNDGEEIIEMFKTGNFTKEFLDKLDVVLNNMKLVRLGFLKDINYNQTTICVSNLPELYGIALSSDSEICTLDEAKGHIVEKLTECHIHHAKQNFTACEDAANKVVDIYREFLGQIYAE